MVAKTEEQKKAEADAKTEQEQQEQREAAAKAADENLGKLGAAQSVAVPPLGYFPGATTRVAPGTGGLCLRGAKARSALVLRLWPTVGPPVGPGSVGNRARDGVSAGSACAAAHAGGWGGSG